ncbi:ThiF family adenylyltransferase [Streptomyces cavernae]|uniref:ThiF family adenylyltransferase n=1 Tax=Streptomyces cavernae TaxID=2259034 RepID=UPI000FEB5D58|nr:ThiF family adenylyltransferase [Streptomyces cavernae]
MTTTPEDHDGARYSRQARFRGIGQQGQERLTAGRVLVVGCGALGSVSADLLARSGVGHITVVDRDFVEVSNLQRQLLFDEADAAAGTPKAVAAAEAIGRINSGIVVEPVVADVTPDNVEALVAGADVVLDGTDNLETRYLLNDACVKARIPWIYGGAVGSGGMAMVVLPSRTPCFRCMFPVPAAAGSLDTCETAGVLASAVVMVSAFQWTEAVKLLVGDREHLNLKLVYFDVWENDRLDSDRLDPAPDCPCCGRHRYEFLDAGATSRTAALCGRNAVQVSPGHEVALDLRELANRLEGVGALTTTRFLLRLALGAHELTVFPDGRAIVKGTSDLSVARSLYARYVGV